MEDTIIFDKCIEQQLEKLLEDHKTSPRVPIIGIVIGAGFRKSLIGVHLSPCPKPEPLVGDVIEEISEDDIVVETKKEEHVKSKKKSKKLPLPKMPLLSEYIDEQWILDHARKLWRGLPGGLDMIGLFFVGDKRAKNELSTILMRGLAQLKNESSKALRLVGKADTMKRLSVLINVELPSTKPELTTIDSAGMSQMNVRFSTQSTRWVEIISQPCFDLTNAVSVQWEASPDINKEQLFELIFLSAIKPYCGSLLDARGLVAGKHRDQGDALLESEPPSRRRGPRGRDSSEAAGFPPVVKADLLLPPTALTGIGHVDQKGTNQKGAGDAAPLSSQLMTAVVTLKGTMQCKAFVPRKATVEEGLLALKIDVIRSLMARCRLHSEGLFVLDPDQGEMEQLHQLPRRAFCRLPLNSLCVCEYAFEGDLPGDVTDTLRHTFSLRGLRESAVELDGERALDYENMLALGLVPPVSREGSTVSGHSESSLDQQAPQPVASTSNYVAILLAVVVGIIAVSAYFVLR